MAVPTRAAWRVLFQNARVHAVRIDARVDAFYNDKFVGAPLGISLDDPDATTRPLTTAEKVAIRTFVVNELDAWIAELQAARTATAGP
jgi:hypothetical protein